MAQASAVFWSNFVFGTSQVAATRWSPPTAPKGIVQKIESKVKKIDREVKKKKMEKKNEKEETRECFPFRILVLV